METNNAQNIGLMDMPDYWGLVEEKHMDPTYVFIRQTVYASNPNNNMHS